MGERSAKTPWLIRAERRPGREGRPLHGGQRGAAGNGQAVNFRQAGQRAEVLHFFSAESEYSQFFESGDGRDGRQLFAVFNVQCAEFRNSGTDFLQIHVLNVVQGEGQLCHVRALQSLHGGVIGTFVNGKLIA